jgi:hypothetical protein
VKAQASFKELERQGAVRDGLIQTDVTEPWDESSSERQSSFHKEQS